MEYLYFKTEDFNCQETGENKMDPEFIRKLDELRAACGWPFVVTSGYRYPTHSIEVKKGIPGTHTQGIAADIKVTGGVQRMDIVQKAMDLGFSGIGVAKGFVHVDTRTTIPVLWVY